MVKFRKRIDKANKIYIPKVVQESGFKGVLDVNLHPNATALAIYPVNADKETVIKSLEVILQDLRNEVERQALGVDKVK